MTCDGSGELEDRLPSLRGACLGGSVDAFVYPTIEDELHLQVFLGCPGRDDYVWACIASPSASPLAPESVDVVYYDPAAEDLDASVAASITGWISRNVTLSPRVRVRWPMQQKGLPNG